MRWLITWAPDTEDENTVPAGETQYQGVLQDLLAHPGALKPGDAILIRRADYLDTALDNGSRTVYGETRTKGHLTLIQGGNT